MKDLVSSTVSTEFIPKKLPQFAAAFAATVGSFSLGNLLGWSAPAIPSLEKDDTFGVHLSNMEKSWIASIVTLGCVLSAFTSGYSMQKFGRKSTMLWLQIPFFVGWLLIAFSKNLLMTLIGRFITGFCGGAFVLVAPVYISEIAEDEIRGALSTIPAIGLEAGTLFVYVSGAMTSWFWLTIACSIFPVLSIFCLFWMPETPRYLLEKGQVELASASLQWFRGTTHPEHISSELNHMEGNMLESKKTSSVDTHLTFELATLKPVFITCMLMVIQQLVGINVIVFYAVEVFESTGSNLDPYIASVIIGTMFVLSVAISAVLVDKVGRKILLVGSGVGIFISLIGLGIYYTLKARNDGIPVVNTGWLPLTSLIIYIITFNVGFGPLPWVLLAEIIPSNVKGLAGALASSLNWGLAFLVTFTFLELVSWLGLDGCFYLFGVVGFIGTIFTMSLVPETKGMSLEEVQNLFQPKRMSVSKL